MKEKNCYLFAAGADPGIDVQPEPGALLLAVDGGYRHLQARGMVPDLLVGDFDSLVGEPPAGIQTVALPREKDDTDTAAAIRIAWQRGCRRFHIYGGVGGRLDHTLANIQCVAHLAARGGRGYLYGKENTITAIHHAHLAFPAGYRGTVSVFAHTDTAVGVYETGMRYSLTDATLHNTNPLGVSNELTGVAARVSVRGGTLVVIYPRDAQPVEDGG